MQIAQIRTYNQAGDELSYNITHYSTH